MDAFLAHFHEITLKKKNRPLFEARLLDNLKKAFNEIGGANPIRNSITSSDFSEPESECALRLKLSKNKRFPPISNGVKIEKTPGGFLIMPRNGFEESAAKSILEKIPGIANFMPVFCVKPDMKEIKKRLGEEIFGLDFSSFRISSVRSDKKFPLTSEGISRELGEFVKQKTKARVDLKNPEKTIRTEIHHRRAFFYFEKNKGTGGLPVGISGKAVSLLSGGIDSPAASYMMMKRGCRVIFVHFHAYPFLDRASIEKAEELVEVLNQYQRGSKLYIVPFGEVQKKIVLSVPEKNRVIMYRRLMVKIASEIAKKEKAGALITGESLGQVASQTMENISVVSEATSLPMFRPLVGMDKEEITELAKKIGTYEISIRSDQDCCQLFTPRHPATKANLFEVKKGEEKLDINSFVIETVEAAEIREYN